jgi:pimeloyl-ACP methyl ester carboxylesterase
MLGTDYPMKVSPLLLELGRSDPLAAIDRVVTLAFSTLAPKPSYPGPGVWLRGGGRALMRQVLAHGRDPMLFHTDFSACDRYANGDKAAAQVRCPVHLVLARFDQMTPPKAAQELAARLEATVHTVAAGHFLMQECPDGVLQALRAALSETAA